MIRRIAFVGFSFAIIIMCGCSSERTPHVSRQGSQAVSLSDVHVAGGAWTLDSLRPVGETVLIDGQTTPISIDMTASGNGHYVLQLSANGKRFRPFLVRMQQGPGQIDFSGQITWFLKAKGKSENIILGLYSIEETDAGKTEVTTLLKQFSRKYDVVCNEKKCAIILFFQKHLFCNCKPAL